jgi:hypothetical protein
MKAAEIAVEYVHPTFKATAIVHAYGSFAERLERAISRSQSPAPTRIENKGPMLEAKLIEPGPPAPRPKAASSNGFVSRRRRLVSD